MVQTCAFTIYFRKLGENLTKIVGFNQTKSNLLLISGELELSFKNQPLTSMKIYNF